MTVDRSYDAANDAERERLGKLVARLSDEELSRPMPAGWTAAAMLAHAGFWDARAVFALEKWATTGAPPPPGDYEPDDVAWINESAKPFLLALPPRVAADLALRLAEEADARFARNSASNTASSGLELRLEYHQNQSLPSATMSGCRTLLGM